MSLLGQVAPDFTLFDTNKESTTLSEYRGRKVVLSFYPAAFTGVCGNQACGFRDAMAAEKTISGGEGVHMLFEPLPFSLLYWPSLNGMMCC